MNIHFRSNQPVHLNATIIFVGGATYAFQCRLTGQKSVCGVHTIVGRKPSDIKELWLEYDGVKYQYPLVMDGKRDGLAVIDIYGGRDKWSELLRRKAMEVPVGE